MPKHIIPPQIMFIPFESCPIPDGGSIFCALHCFSPVIIVEAPSEDSPNIPVVLLDRLLKAIV